MRNLLRLMLLVVVILVGIWLWHFFFPNPQKVIRNHLNKLAQLASFSGNEGNFSRVAHVEQMGAFFTDNVEVSVNIPGLESHTFNGRAELTQVAMAARSSVGSLGVEVFDMNIQMGANDQSALVDLTFRARIGSERDAIVQELNVTFKKVNRDWLISRVTTVQALKR